MQRQKIYDGKTQNKYLQTVVQSRKIAKGSQEQPKWGNTS